VPDLTPATPEERAVLRLPALLVIMDGFGITAAGPGNAVSLARTPNLDRLFARGPWAPVACSGLAVGLPDGQQGNSEVGHLNIGAGRVVYQELTRINLAVEDGSLGRNAVLGGAIDAAVADGRAVHFMGLVSDGGVHSHISHLFGLLDMAVARGASRVYVHCFLDGRDVPPESGAGFVDEVAAKLADLGVGRIATVSGRYWAMDRDTRWDRVERAWKVLVGVGAAASSPIGGPAGDPVGTVRASYDAGVTDEFVAPVRLTADGVLEDGDAVVFFNFRPDRARELTRALVDPDFDGFARPAFPRLRFVCLTEYDPTIPAPVAFPKDFPKCVLADVLADAGLRQLHIAETEKYAHVTFFLNGGSEPPRPGEERVLVPSPKVATYDLQPEMSEPGVTERLVAAIGEDRADVYIVNFANCDMVGHTGILDAAVRAVEAVDDGVGRVVAAVRAKGGSALVTADHGNAERMVAADGETPFTAHTTDAVPLICVADGVSAVGAGGRLADVAPSLLDLVGLPRPDLWTGRSLLVR
jgi:2,3-bisphosphoglycerate-independent phosphoglycerate mutase